MADVTPDIQGGMLMLAHKYQIHSNAWGSPSTDTNCETRNVGVMATAKRDPESPNAVFNELVALQLGQLIGLSIPQGMVVEYEKTPFFASCHCLETGGGRLPECDFSRFCKERPREACGTMVFDAWIANSDRHDENMYFDYYQGSYFLIDHDQAILGSLGESNLAANEQRLGIRTTEPALKFHISSFSHFPYWYERIQNIPNETIENLTKNAMVVGVDPVLAQRSADWLIDRKSRLKELFKKEKTLFPKLEKAQSQDLIDPFGDYDDTRPEYQI